MKVDLNLPEGWRVDRDERSAGVYLVTARDGYGVRIETTSTEVDLPKTYAEIEADSRRMAAQIAAHLKG